MPNLLLLGNSSCKTSYLNGLLFYSNTPICTLPKVDIQAITHTDGVEISEYQGGPQGKKITIYDCGGTKRCKPEEVYPKADYAIIFTGGKGWTPEQYQEELVKFAPHVKFCFLEKPDYLRFVQIVNTI